MASAQSPLERRLIELIANFEAFGNSYEAKHFVERLPDTGRKHFEKWLIEAESPEVEKRRIGNAEYQRRFPERKKAAFAAETIPDTTLEPPDEAQR